MAMHDVGRGPRCASCHMHNRADVACPDVPAHWNPREAERKHGRKICKRRFRRGAAGRCVRHKPDPVPARDLPASEIDDMAEEAADGSAQDVKNAQAPRSGRRRLRIR
jgi:hypothetical protein